MFQNSVDIHSLEFKGNGNGPKSGKLQEIQMGRNSNLHGPWEKKQ
jgi:hypothetical protein